jgi:predicted membrane protein
MIFPKKTNIAIALSVAIAIFVIYFFFDPARYNLFPKCPFHTLTGLDCPGCGSQRAIHALLHGDILAACNYNILLVISIPLLMVHLGYKVISAIKNRQIQWKLLYHPYTPKVIFVIVVLFWISRNIPVYPFSYLAAGR